MDEITVTETDVDAAKWAFDNEEPKRAASRKSIRAALQTLADRLNGKEPPAPDPRVEIVREWALTDGQDAGNFDRNVAELLAKLDEVKP